MKSLFNLVRKILFPPSACDIGALLTAAADGQADDLRELLATASPNVAMPDGSTLLIAVTISDAFNSKTRLEMLDVLIQAGALPDRGNKTGATPLMFAAGMGDESFCRALLGAGASIGRRDSQGDTALIWGTSTGNLPSLEALITAGADVNHQNKKRQTPLMYAARTGRTDHISELLRAGARAELCNDQGMHALRLAAEYGKSEAAGLLARETPGLLATLPLFAAAATGFVDVVKERLSTPESFAEMNESGFTALELAVIGDHREIVELLLPRYEGLPQAKNSALGCACLKHSVEFTQLLLEKGADPNQADDAGDTALILAAASDFADGVRLLVQYGADQTLKNLSGQDAQDAARANNAYEALQALFKHQN